MSFEDLKKYISDLCIQVYGLEPKKITPFQRTFSITINTAFSPAPSNAIDFGNPVFIRSFQFAHSKKVAGMENFIAFGITSPTSKTMQVRYNTELDLLCRYLKVTSSESGDTDITIVGYQCSF
jgi:hypothetical protein